MITRKIKIPTGYLCTYQGSKGELEFLSIGDYGKKHNIKADFLGYKNEINGVPNMEVMPLSEKWVITLSTQYGCVQRCKFCDVPNIPFRGNATFEDLQNQFFEAIKLFPDVKYTDRLNIHFARMGEPIFNNNVFEFSKWLYANKYLIKTRTGLSIEVIHPVLTTSMPKTFKQVLDRLHEWSYIKNGIYNGQAGLQLSINSTDDEQREYMFGGSSVPLYKISKIANELQYPKGRKYCLNFAFSSDYIVDENKLLELFDPEKFMCKITPIHNNNACRKNGIETKGGYETFDAYRDLEERLKKVGFDVLIFVPSMDEENGCVTCGNLILGGSKLKI